MIWSIDLQRKNISALTTITQDNTGNVTLYQEVKV
jgi:hypothetical protein